MGEHRSPNRTVYWNANDDAPLALGGRSNVENLFAFDPGEAQGYPRVGTGQFRQHGLYTASDRVPTESDAVFDPTCTQTFERRAGYGGRLNPLPLV